MPGLRSSGGLGLRSGSGGGVRSGSSLTGLSGGSSRGGNSFKNWYNQGRNVRVPNENTLSWKTGRQPGDDRAQIGDICKSKKVPQIQMVL